MATTFGILGPLEVRAEDGSRVPLGGQKPRELLAALLLHRGHVLSVDKLVSFLWGDSASPGAVITIRTYIGQLRRILALAGSSASLTSAARGGYRLDAAPYAVDAERFDRLLQEGRELYGVGKPDEAATVLDQALSLWRGDFLADLNAPDFAAPSAARLQELHVVAWESWLDTQLALGRHEMAVAHLQTLVEAHPFREGLAAQLMLALYRCGRQADALAVATDTRRRLAEELGLDPGKEVRELEAAILRQDSLLDIGFSRAPLPGASRLEGSLVSGRLSSDRVVLLERESELAAIGAAFDSATIGEGSVVGVVGDAGTGKSTLLRVACADARGVRVLRGTCDALPTPRPLGPFRDVADELGLGALLDREDVPLFQICQKIFDALRSRPSALVIDDLHWIDAASVDVIRFISRRLEAMPLALLMAYRDREIGDAHPARLLLGDVARVSRSQTLHLDPLTSEGVRKLVEGSNLDPGRVHAVTGGNPFFVAEVAKNPDHPLPASIRDAILARTVGIAEKDFDVLRLAATAPDRLDDRLLPILGVDMATLRRLDGTGLLSRVRGGLAFRHELSRQAIVSTIPPGGSREVHARLLAALERSELHDPPVLTHHAVEAGDAAAAARHARDAAEESTRAGSHTEAAVFYEIALQNHSGAPPEERAELLQALGHEKYMINRLPEAIESVRATFPFWQQAGDFAGLALAHEACAIYEYSNGRRQRAEAEAARAASIAGSSHADVAEGVARATRGFLAFMQSDIEVAVKSTNEAAGLARKVNSDRVVLRADILRGLTHLSAGDIEKRSELAERIALARSYGLDEVASAGYSQLVYLDVEQHRYRAAEQILETSLPFAHERELLMCRYWQTGVRARLHFAHADWTAAMEDAEHVLGEQGFPVTMLWPLLVTSLVPLRRGEVSDSMSGLQAAWELSESLREPLRRLPVLSALAEVMWMTGWEDPRVTEDAVNDVERLAPTPGAEWLIGDLATWLQRLDLLEKPPSIVAEPYRAAFEGRFDQAAGWWRQNGEPFTEAMVLGDSPDPVHKSRAIALLESLDAKGTALRQRSALSLA